MKLSHLICRIVKRRFSTKYITLNKLANQKQLLINDTQKILPIATSRKKHSEIVDVEADDKLEFIEYEDAAKEDTFARNVLFKDSNDPILNNFSKCASVEDVFKIFTEANADLKTQHLAQTVFVLNDLSKMYYLINAEISEKLEFLNKLYQRDEFNILLQQIDNKIDQFEIEHLVLVQSYLSKMGINAESELLQKMSVRIKDELFENFSLEQCALFIRVIFMEKSIRPYNLVEKLVPKVLNYIGDCQNVEELGHLTACLQKCNAFVTKDKILKYKAMLRKFLKKKSLNATHYKTILKILVFLNHPSWRNYSSALMSELMLLLKNDIDELAVQDIVIIYQIFFKTQEPGSLLNKIQHNSSKFLQSDEPMSYENRLKLFSSLIYFSSPTHRLLYRKYTEKYITECNTLSSFIMLRKVLSFIKINDYRLCELYWNSLLKLLKEERDLSNVLTMCYNYMNFNIDIDDYRHANFEKAILNRLDEINDDTYIAMFPSKLSVALNFLLVYGKNQKLINYLIDKIDSNYTQLSHTDIFKMSRSLNLVGKANNKFLIQAQTNRVNDIITKSIKHLQEFEFDSTQAYIKNDYLLKANISRYELDSDVTDTMIMNYKKVDFTSSKVIEHASYCFKLSNSLVPEVINRLTNYVIKHDYNILAFNAEKLLYLCYYLGYYPYNASDFLRIVTNIIIRDQERLSGLAFLQSALSLCYFNNLPSSFIKNIFNVEFLEKLDVELANCYSKDTYPQRVRNSLMQLNRAVCLEYPQYNVPWFHQKYVDEVNKKTYKRKEEYVTFFTMRQNLVTILENPELLIANVITPYGYRIDFVVNFDRKNKAVESTSPNIHRKLAILLVPQHAFTRFYIQLKGKYQFKKRHLELLGYKVKIINCNDWLNLLYPKEKLDFVANILWPTKRAYDFVNR